MKRKVSRIVALLVALMMFLSLAVACGQKAETTETTIAAASSEATTQGTTADPKLDVSEKKELIFYLLGDGPKDGQAVWDEIAKKSEVNVSLKVNYLNWSDCWTKGPLLLQSGEPFDAIFSANWFGPNADNASKGAFLPLDDLLQKYGPNILKNVPPAALEQARLAKDKKIYMIPWGVTASSRWAMIIREDLRQKYSAPEPSSFETLMPYLEAIKTNEKEMIPYFQSSNALYDNLNLMMFTKYGYYGLANMMYVKGEDPAPKAMFLWELPEFKDCLKVLREYYTKGYIQKNVLSEKLTKEDAFTNGKAAVYMGAADNLNALYSKIKVTNPDWVLKPYMIYPEQKASVLAYTNNGIALGVNSKNPERTIMFIDWCLSSQENYDLITYGIQGKHYELQGDSLAQVAGATEVGYDQGSSFMWWLKNDKYDRNDTRYHPDFKAFAEKNNSTNIYEPALLLLGISGDTFKAEVAAMYEVHDKYMNPLYAGVLDIDAGLAKFEENMKAVNLQKIKDETQRQIDAFLASRK